jgi:ribonuclease BN (tRNA processing enzyme)
MEVIFLGTNGWYDTELGNTQCAMVRHKDYCVIFDAGNGIYKVDNYIKEKTDAYLFISHFHLDHIIGLHILCKFKCFNKMKIFGPSGTKDIFKQLIDLPFTVPVSELDFPVELYDLSIDKVELPFRDCKEITITKN